VARPAADRVNQRRANSAQRTRSRNHSTAATTGVATKCEKYTQLASTSHQWIAFGLYKCCCNQTVGTSPPVNQPNMPRSVATISITCGVAPLSANPREKL